MPRRDGTGPNGAGPMTGRVFGFCRDPRANPTRYGAGFGLGLGLKFGLKTGRRKGFGRWLDNN